MKVLKFGGTSVADPAAIERLIAIVRREAAADRAPRDRSGHRAGTVVVVSAVAGVTDDLLALAEFTRRGDVTGALGALAHLRERHHAFAGAVAAPHDLGQLRAGIDAECEGLSAAIRALGVLRDVSPRSSDAVAAVGELLSSRLVAAALSGRELPTVWVDPRRLIMTDETFTTAAPVFPDTWDQVAAVVTPLLEEGRIVVTGGFVAATRDGRTTTLGRGGSDYSAALIGAGIQADEIQIWTDVNGMLTADPRVHRSPKLVTHLSFAEAAELAFFGAKVLHPKTIQPALSRGIPVRILNSRRSEAAGTLITAQPDRTAAPVAALACKRKVTVIDVTSTRMLEAYGFLRRLFEVFERHQTSVDVVTTSEVSVSVTIDDRRQLTGIVEALSGFAEVVVEDDMALIGIVGDNLPTDPGTFGRIVGALGRTPLKLVSQAASRRNVTLVLPAAELEGAVARLHQEFFGEEVAVAVGADPVARHARENGLGG